MRFISNPIIYLCLAFSLIFICKSKAQFYDYGQEPAFLKWKQINTDSFQVIFPSGFEKDANRLANVLHYLYGPVSKNLRHRPGKISVVLHNYASYSNGMVAWAPKLMDLYPLPPQENYATDWIEQLAVHELRHVVQIDKLNQGLSHMAYLLFGEQAIGAIAGLMPRWYFEGDAVAAETALSSSGRGRVAAFEMEMKAIVSNQNKLYSYEKALRGSYRDHVPDPYQLGYPIIAYTRRNFGQDVFSKTEDFVARNPYILFPFPISLKKNTGLPLRKLYAATYTDLKKHWEKQISEEPLQTARPWKIPNKKGYTNYQFPHYINDTTLILVKSGIDQLTEFILLYANGKEVKLHTPGFYSKDQFSYAAGKYCWAEQIPDIRWSNRSYSCIKTGNLASGKIRALTRKSRYFAPTLSPDGKKIAAIEVTPANEPSVIILDSETGKIDDRIAPPENNFLQLPAWLNDGSGLVMLSSNRKGKSIVTLTLAGRQWNTLVSPTFRNLNYPADAGDHILFTSDFKGTDNLYAVSKTNGSIFQVTHEKYGASFPKINANTHEIIYTSYSSLGYSVFIYNSAPDQWSRFENISDTSPKLYQDIANQENFNFQDSIIPQKEFSIKKYSKSGHLINIHSWAPFYYNYNDLSGYNSAYPGITLISRDKLGTSFSTLGYAYANNSSYLKSSISYRGLYPVIDVSVSYGGKTSFTRYTNVAVPNIQGYGFQLTTRAYIPFNFTRNRYFKGLTPYTDWQYNNEYIYNPYTTKYQQGTSKIGFGIDAYIYRRQSLRDLAPKLGNILNAKYVTAPFEKNLLGSIYLLQDRIFLPGFANHHSLQLSAGIQQQSGGIHIFSLAYLPFPRGYTTEGTYSMKTFTSTYAFPVAYPDWKLTSAVYVKRLRCNVFYDFAQRRDPYFIKNQKVWFTDDFYSSGVDLLADFHLFRIIFPMQIGIRMAYISETKEYSSQLLFNVNLTSF